MPEITLSKQQVEYLEGLREHIAEEHVGPYGHVRMREAVQFLIDRYEAEGDAERATVRRAVEDCLADRSYQELQSLAADADGVEPGGKAEELRARLVEAKVDDALADAVPGSIDENEPARDGDERADETRAHSENAGPGGAGSEGSSEASSVGDGTSADDGSGGGGSRLERMMGLLDDHDDRWEETDSDEGRYAVTLPDGTVEHVRTKDDVRATLFRHYD